MRSVGVDVRGAVAVWDWRLAGCPTGSSSSCRWGSRRSYRRRLRSSVGVVVEESPTPEDAKEVFAVSG